MGQFGIKLDNLQSNGKIWDKLKNVAENLKMWHIKNQNGIIMGQFGIIMEQYGI